MVLRNDSFLKSFLYFWMAPIYMKNIELLSPARNAITGIAAVNCGADAVYIGAGKFGLGKKQGTKLVKLIG